MSKLKYFTFILIWFFMPKTCFSSETLVLSDKIQEAREIQMKIAKTHIQQNVEQIKNQVKTKPSITGEYNAAEKLNPAEIIKQEK